MSPPGTQALELSTSPPPVRNQRPPNLKTSPQKPVSECPAPLLPRDLGVPASPLLQDPLGPGVSAPSPRFPDPGFPPSSSPILKRRVSEAALASPWQQESILRWEHTAPPQRAPPHPAPPTWGQERVGAPRGRVGFQSEGRDTDARRVRDL